MKISQDIRSQLDSTKKNPLQQTTDTKNFNSYVTTQTSKLKEQELQEVMKQLTVQGEKLLRFRSFQDLAKYKRMVKGFIKEAVQYGMETKQSHSWNMEGNNRKLTIVAKIDDKLIELTDILLAQEKNSIGVLDVIGEIKGLLVNLYT